MIIKFAGSNDTFEVHKQGALFICDCKDGFRASATNLNTCLQGMLNHIKQISNESEDKPKIQIVGLDFETHTIDEAIALSINDGFDLQKEIIKKAINNDIGEYKPINVIEIAGTGNINKVVQQLAKAQYRITELSADLTNLKNCMDDMNKCNFNLCAENSNLRATLEQLRQDFQKAWSENTDNISNLENKTQALNLALVENKDLKCANSHLAAENSKLKSEHETLKSNLVVVNSTTGAGWGSSASLKPEPPSSRDAQTIMYLNDAYTKAKTSMCFEEWLAQTVYKASKFDKISNIVKHGRE